jgi:diguanylate cyclase (GGDEF)-like protein/PAS domain S-box-containing protein
LSGVRASVRWPPLLAWLLIGCTLVVPQAATALEQVRLYDEPAPWWLSSWVLPVLVLVTLAAAVAWHILRFNRRLAREVARRRGITWTLRASRRRYRLLFDTVPVGLVVLDRAHRIRDWNRAAEQIFGWPRHQVIGESIDRLLPADERDDVLKVMEQTWQGRSVSGHNQNLTRDGHTILCRWVNVLQRDGSGAPGTLLAVAEDITETTRTRYALEVANRSLHNQIERIEALQVELREQAIRDPLTGLYNRRYLQSVLERELARRECAALALVIIDIDHFKDLNDQFGREAGDQALVALARLLTAGIRASDIAVRYSGEEFVVVLPGTGLAVALARAESWRRAVAELLIPGEQGEARMTLSGGVAAWPEHGLTAEALLRAADRALNTAKRGGSNRIVVAGG